MTVLRTLLPSPRLARPKEYSNGIVARGTMIWTGGVVGSGIAETFPDGAIEPVSGKHCRRAG